MSAPEHVGEPVNDDPIPGGRSPREAQLPEPAETLSPDLAPANPLDALAMDEPIFTDGPLRGEIEELKNKFPQAKIMATLLADGTGIVWRTMNRMDWRRVQGLLGSIQDSDRREEIIFSKIVLWPDTSDPTTVGMLPAGAVTSVLNEFYMMSGFTPVAESIRL